MERIGVIRREIDAVDNNIIQLLKRRFMLAKKAGEYKKKNGLKKIDRKREEEILQKITRHAKSIGLDSKSAGEIFRVIIKEGRKIQKWGIQTAGRR